MNYSEKPSCKVKIDDIIYIFSKENMTGILRSFLRGIWKIMRKREEKRECSLPRGLYHRRDTYVKLQKYKRVPVLHYPEREWPDKEIEHAPMWCSVDLRDGNQALIDPMNVEEKMEMFRLLLKLGFKQIEIGFPAASQIEYDFLRKLVAENMIPDDVQVQVLTQCREHLIDRTFEAIQGIKNVIVHIYNSTSVLQRDVVFHKDKRSHQTDCH